MIPQLFSTARTQTEAFPWNADFGFIIAKKLTVGVRHRGVKIHGGLLRRRAQKNRNNDLKALASDRVHYLRYHRDSVSEPTRVDSWTIYDDSGNSAIHRLL